MLPVYPKRPSSIVTQTTVFLSRPNLFSFVLHLHDLWKHNYWQIKIFWLKDPTLTLKIPVTPKTAVRWMALCIIIIPKINMWSLWVMAIMPDVTCGLMCVNFERMMKLKSAIFICITFRDLITSVCVCVGEDFIRGFAANTTYISLSLDVFFQSTHTRSHSFRRYA